MADWHVALARFGRFAHATKALEALDCVTEICAPTRSETWSHRGRMIERALPWLGHVLLARWQTDDPHAWHDVNGLPDVSGILGGWPPKVVPEAAIERFLDQIRLIEGANGADMPPPCQPGDVVRFSFGPFFRLMARCCWVCTGVVGLRVPMLGTEVLVQTPFAAIEYTEPAHAVRGGRRRYGRG